MWNKPNTNHPINNPNLVNDWSFNQSTNTNPNIWNPQTQQNFPQGNNPWETQKFPKQQSQNPWDTQTQPKQQQPNNPWNTQTQNQYNPQGQPQNNQWNVQKPQDNIWNSQNKTTNTTSSNNSWNTQKNLQPNINQNPWDIQTNQSNQDQPPMEFTNVQDTSVHYNVTCDGCKSTPVIGRRYRCLECRDFDYCEKCFYKNRQIHQHNFNGITQLREEIHMNTTCDGCHASPIYGSRYRCESCLDFDYCEKCYRFNASIHRHRFRKI